MSACVTSALLEQDRQETITVEGTVTAVTSSGVDGTCLTSSLNIIGGQNFADDTRVQTIVLQAGDDTVTVAVVSDDDVPFDVGDDVRLLYSFFLGGFSPDRGRLLMTDAAGATLYMEEAGTIEDLSLPAEVTLSKGDSACWSNDGCGGWSRYAVLAAADGASPVPLSTTAATDVAGLAFRSTALEASDANQGGHCLDWFVAHVLVSATSTP